MIAINDATGPELSFLTGSTLATPYAPSAVRSRASQAGETAISTIIIDGTLTDWTPAQRLDNGSIAGFALYADVQAANFVFGIGDDSGTIGPGTTIWLDTDLNSTTGYQVFGNTVGAEYNIDIGTDGVARLYSGGAGQTLIGTLNYAVSSDGHGFEFAVPESLIGNVTAANVFADVDNTTFLPGVYSSGGYRVGSLTSTVVGSITIDGSLTDWTQAQRLDTPSTGVNGYALYGAVQSNTFLFALSSTIAIGPNTTIWLDTDGHASTGYQIFGFAGGAEYNINIGADNTPRLYTGGAGQTFVADLAYNYSADHKSLEIALPNSLMSGSPTGAQVLADINDTVFLPTNYSDSYLVGTLLPGLTVSPATRIAIVYSDTSAANFYSKTAYGQLFLAAQDQAMQAGIPFDLLTEGDLKDPAKLVNYKAIVFPGLANVKAADLDAITYALTVASKDYRVGLIAAGNFLTNNENGAAFAGDSYARMKSLLGVTYETSGATSGIRLVADAGSNPILNGYTQGETVGDYSNISYQSFTDVTGTGQVLFDQIAGGATHSAVIATTPLNGGRNVSFASDAIMGNNNIIQKAIDWVAEPTSSANVKLSMTRFNSLFASRTDLDQAMETSDVSGTQPGIYDVMVPIIQEWKSHYNFVGSFYVDIGDNPPDQVTDWTKSAPYFQQLLAMGNEIGSHSYTHPDDTNLLVPTSAASPQLLALLAQTDPRNPNAVDPSTLSASDRALLNTSFQFQFEYSKLALEKALGITISGAAVPGNPETVDTAHQIIPYYDYISGGYAGVGSGFPNAFGFLTPADLGKVYLAPNMKFDFSLVGFQHLSPAAATAEWLNEFAQINSHATTPIFVWPWHDYGVTNWNVGGAGTYDLSMYTSVLDAAAASGTEFVTSQDLANRIEEFQASKLTISQTGNDVIATLTSPDAGKFALTVGEATTHIASATLGGSGWYAWDANKLLLPAGGGTFDITLGTPADVTHLAALAMRADLQSVTGDGTNLSFSFTGSGTATVDLKTQGTNSVIATGADDGSVSGEQLSLTFTKDGMHTVQIKYGPGGTITGTAANEIIIGGSGNDTIITGGGIDHLFGGAGNDTYYVDNSGDTVTEAVGGGNDTVYASVNYTLQAGQEVENLIANAGTTGLTLTGNEFNNTITGGAGNDTLNGGAGNDTLDGGAGADTMAGGAGNDTYYVDNVGDVVTEAAGAGTDTVNTTLNSYTLPANVENLTFIGTGNFSGTGNALNNTITGGAGNDTLDGGAGNDTLYGGAGQDSFLFDTTLNANTNVDLIFDFSSIDDKVLLSHSIFTQAGSSGTLAAGAFNIGSAAADSNGRIIYDSGTGALRYDSDGTGLASATQFATVSAGLALTNNNFQIV